MSIYLMSLGDTDQSQPMEILEGINRIYHHHLTSLVIKINIA